MPVVPNAKRTCTAIIEKTLELWVKNTNANNLTVSEIMIKEKAFYFAQEFNIPYENILFSNGWIEKFKRHNNICCYRLHGKANSIPLEILFEKRRKLQTILQDYILDNIFNADETSLFFCMAPNQTLVSALTSGIKLDKTHITVLLATNAIGTQKLKPLVISSSKNPRCLYRVNRNSLPLTEHTNDNLNLSHVRVHFLPPNTTAHLQSMDAGIIKSLRQFINNITYDILSPLTDAEIIQLILEKENKNPKINNDNKEEHPVISIQEGFNSLKTWVQYFEEQESKEFDMKEIKIFKKYMGIMHRKLFKSKTQKNITSFFISDNM
ncbi:tigger transposable element-derived protein 6-like [Rhizophagus clarus]|uniref:Tigger transposable element-derived protein 6-like n=1 Tax=Rhizophagus clarus TaxID=94130 RepID=A0A8H3KXM9_9GLOM|nr:tigger transposable element-derived protein 6-like [Rhizophagus clarus]